MAFEEVTQALVDFGLLDVVLPFVIVFTITFGLLQRNQMFESKKVNAMIAFVFGFIIIATTNLLNLIGWMLNYFMILILVGLLLSILAGFLGVGTGNSNKVLKAILAVLAFLFFMYALSQAGFIDWDKFLRILFPLLGLSALLGVMWYMLRGAPSAAGEKTPTGTRAPKKRGVREAPVHSEEGPLAPEVVLEEKELKKKGPIWKGGR